jgi:hypothetical protein
MSRQDQKSIACSIIEQSQQQAVALSRVNFEPKHFLKAKFSIEQSPHYSNISKDRHFALDLKIVDIMLCFIFEQSQQNAVYCLDQSQ